MSTRFARFLAVLLIPVLLTGPGMAAVPQAFLAVPAASDPLLYNSQALIQRGICFRNLFGYAAYARMFTFYALTLSVAAAQQTTRPIRPAPQRPPIQRKAPPVKPAPVVVPDYRDEIQLLLTHAGSLTATFHRPSEQTWTYWQDFWAINGTYGVEAVRRDLQPLEQANARTPAVRAALRKVLSDFSKLRAEDIEQQRSALDQIDRVAAIAARMLGEMAESEDVLALNELFNRTDRAQLGEKYPYHSYHRGDLRNAAHSALVTAVSRTTELRLLYSFLWSSDNKILQVVKAKLVPLVATSPMVQDAVIAALGAAQKDVAQAHDWETTQVQDPVRSGWSALDRLRTAIEIIRDASPAAGQDLASHWTRRPVVHDALREALLMILSRSIGERDIYVSLSPTVELAKVGVVGFEVFRSVVQSQDIPFLAQGTATLTKDIKRFIDPSDLRTSLTVLRGAVGKVIGTAMAMVDDPALLQFPFTIADPDVLNGARDAIIAAIRRTTDKAVLLPLVSAGDAEIANVAANQILPYAATDPAILQALLDREQAALWKPVMEHANPLTALEGVRALSGSINPAVQQAVSEVIRGIVNNGTENSWQGVLDLSKGEPYEKSLLLAMLEVPAPTQAMQQAVLRRLNAFSGDPEIQRALSLPPALLRIRSVFDRLTRRLGLGPTPSPAEIHFVWTVFTGRLSADWKYDSGSVPAARLVIAPRPSAAPVRTAVADASGFHGQFGKAPNAGDVIQVVDEHNAVLATDHRDGAAPPAPVTADTHKISLPPVRVGPNGQIDVALTRTQLGGLNLAGYRLVRATVSPASHAHPFQAAFVPNNVGLLLDVSSSMNGSKLQDLKRAVRQASPVIKDAMVISFSGEISVLKRIGDSKPVADVVNRLAAAGNTHGWEALLTFREELKNVPEADLPRHIVIVTDGEFNDALEAGEGYKRLIEAAKYFVTARIRVSVLGIGADYTDEGGRAAATHVRENLFEGFDRNSQASLREFVALTGGRFIAVPESGIVRGLDDLLSGKEQTAEGPLGPNRAHPGTLTLTMTNGARTLVFEGPLLPAEGAAIDLADSEPEAPATAAPAEAPSLTAAPVMEAPPGVAPAPGTIPHQSAEQRINLNHWINAINHAYAQLTGHGGGERFENAFREAQAGAERMAQAGDAAWRTVLSETLVTVEQALFKASAGYQATTRRPNAAAIPSDARGMITVIFRQALDSQVASAIARLNSMLIPRGWGVVFDDSDREPLRVAALDGSETFHIIYKTEAGATGETAVTLWTGSGRDAVTGEAKPVSPGTIALRMGPRNAPLLFKDKKSVDSVFGDFVSDPDMLESLGRDGWLDANGDPRPGLREALERAAIEHELAHQLTATLSGLSKASNGEDEEMLAYMGMLLGDLRHAFLRLMVKTAGAPRGQMHQHLLSRLAIEAGQIDLAADLMVPELAPAASKALETYLLALPAADFGDAVKKAKEVARKKLGAPIQWDFRAGNPQIHPHKATLAQLNRSA